MVDMPIEREFVRSWIVCEETQRWESAARRFAPEMMPPQLIPAVVPASKTHVRGIVSGIDKAVVLWEVRRESLASACDCLAAVSSAAPNVLQLLAIVGLTNRERLVLSEFRCAATIRHPEELPRLAGMIEGYFATDR